MFNEFHICINLSEGKNREKEGRKLYLTCSKSDIWKITEIPKPQSKIHIEIIVNSYWSLSYWWIVLSIIYFHYSIKVEAKSWFNNLNNLSVLLSLLQIFNIWRLRLFAISKSTHILIKGPSYSDELKFRCSWTQPLLLTNLKRCINDTSWKH